MREEPGPWSAGVRSVLLCGLCEGPGVRHPEARDRRDEPGARGIVRGVSEAARESDGGHCVKRRFLSATHSTTHDDAAGHHHAGSPVRLQGGQRARVVSHDAIMTDWVAMRQIARMPRRNGHGILQIAQCSFDGDQAPSAPGLTGTLPRICCPFQQNTCASDRTALTIAVEALPRSVSTNRTP